MMQSPVELRITIEQEDAEKLADLAGGEEHVAQYLTNLIRKLHAEHSVVGGDLRLEQLVAEADLLIQKQQEYQATIGMLKTRLKRMTMSQEELMATVQHLDDVLFASLRRQDGH